ncbi:hypothetical protein HK104_003477 [Borealophlyctis nickersoniae]|nr:hypothetical protein HK104_003477 [Borealophlyctis nickersoniae]
MTAPTSPDDDASETSPASFPPISPAEIDNVLSQVTTKLEAEKYCNGSKHIFGAMAAAVSPPGARGTGWWWDYTHYLVRYEVALIQTMFTCLLDAEKDGQLDIEIGWFMQGCPNTNRSPRIGGMLLERYYEKVTGETDAARDGYWLPCPNSLLGSQAVRISNLDRYESWMSLAGRLTTSDDEWAMRRHLTLTRTGPTGFISPVPGTAPTGLHVVAIICPLYITLLREPLVSWGKKLQSMHNSAQLTKEVADTAFTRLREAPTSHPYVVLDADRRTYSDAIVIMDTPFFYSQVKNLPPIPYVGGVQLLYGIPLGTETSMPFSWDGLPEMSPFNPLSTTAECFKSLSISAGTRRDTLMISGERHLVAYEEPMTVWDYQVTTECECKGPMKVQGTPVSLHEFISRAVEPGTIVQTFDDPLGKCVAARWCTGYKASCVIRRSGECSRCVVERARSSGAAVAII